MPRRTHHGGKPEARSEDEDDREPPSRQEEEEESEEGAGDEEEGEDEAEDDDGQDDSGALNDPDDSSIATIDTNNTWSAGVKKTRGCRGGRKHQWAKWKREQREDSWDDKTGTWRSLDQKWKNAKDRPWRTNPAWGPARGPGRSDTDWPNQRIPVPKALPAGGGACAW